MVTDRTLVVGVGVSGLSVVRYLARSNVGFDLADQKPELPEALLQSEPALQGRTYFGGGWDSELLCRYSQLVVSPGVPTRTEPFSVAAKAGAEIIGDVELFARATAKPVLAVTGSNGKSTVVSMVGAILQAAGLRVAVVGNVGLACLDGLDDDNTDVYVLELSSFQLETTKSLKPDVSCVLNVCEDHLDRYDGIEDYAAVKRSIYRDAGQVVFNIDDTRTTPSSPDSAVRISMNDTAADWYLDDAQQMCGPDGLRVDSRVLNVAGGHNRINALAAMAISVCHLQRSAVGKCPVSELQQVMINGLSAFNGLSHRSELICSVQGVEWFNDSKGTNVGACVSAIEGMNGPVVLIAGGRGKNADYAPLKPVVSGKCRAVVLIGEDAKKIHQAIGDDVPVYFERSMHDAVSRAREVALHGDNVLLSPACSSFDMFDNFEARGVIFSEEVRKLCA
jgi:UDP-N-acetylmuramoylalanine--D-glutamate ligase